MYVFPEDSLKFWQIATALLILLAITALVLWAWRHRYLPVGWFWFLGTLVPMIGFVQVGSQAMADRYAYLPFVGLFLMVTWGVADVFAGLQKRGAPLRADRKSTSPAGAFVTIEAGVAIAVLLVLTVLTARQVGRWKDNITLWEYALKVTSNNYVAETNLGIALEKDGRTFDAMPHFFRAIAMHPAAPGANLEVAMYYQRMGMLPQAIAQDKKLLSLTQSPVQRAEILSNMGFAYGALGDYPQARASFQEAVNDNPNHSRAWMGLGVVSQKSGELTQAIDDYTHSVQGHPSDVTYLLLARALKQSGRNDEAEAALRSAKLLSQNFEQTQRMADALIAH